MSAALDYAAGDPHYTTSLPGDWNDTAQMAPFQNPLAVQQGMTWWEGLAAYGLTRAIDNRFAPPSLTGNTDPGSFGGQNGATYSNANGIPPLIGGVPNSWLLLGAAAAVALYVVTR